MPYSRNVEEAPRLCLSARGSVIFSGAAKALARRVKWAIEEPLGRVGPLSKMRNDRFLPTLSLKGPSPAFGGLSRAWGGPFWA